MASPQLEHGHIRIANEIIDEVLRRDFSKRQQSILHFIWRLSYGCNKKSATIPRLKDFHLCGVNQQNVRAELEHLETCKVIFWDRENDKFTFNKNHKDWIITPIKGWNKSDFDKLLHLNIQEKFLKQEENGIENFSKQEESTSQNKKLAESGKDETSQIKKSERKKLLKLRTFDFLKQEVPNGLKLYRTRLGWVPKDSIKDIKDKDIKDINNNNNDNANPFTFYESNFEPFIPPAIRDRMIDWLDDFSEEMMILAMEKSLEQGSDKATWAYVNRILVNWHKKGLKTPDDVEKDDAKFYAKQQRRFGNRQQPEVIPEWFNKRKQQNKQQQQQEIDPATAEKERQELADMIRQYS